MVNANQKGARGESLVRDLLRKYTEHKWERVPQSGALEYLKGDLYIPQSANKFLIEVKNFKEINFDITILTNKSNLWLGWWDKCVDQAIEMDQEPLLFFKHNRSKLFLSTIIKPKNIKNYFYISDVYTVIAEDWLLNEKIKWIK